MLCFKFITLILCVVFSFLCYFVASNLVTGSSGASPISKDALLGYLAEQQQQAHKMRWMSNTVYKSAQLMHYQVCNST